MFRLICKNFLFITLSLFAFSAKAGFQGQLGFFSQMNLSLLAGSTDGAGFSDGPASQAMFRAPNSSAVDSNNNVYVADTTHHIIRKITAAGVVSTFAGSNGAEGFVDGNGSNARFNLPLGIAVDAADNIYVADANNHAIRMINASGSVTTLAGTGTAGAQDGVAVTATFNTPSGVAVDITNNIYVADTKNHLIRKISAGTVSTMAGTAGIAGSWDETGIAASFSGPTGIATDAAGNVYISDTGNHTIRKMTAAGVVNTLAGTAGFDGFMDGVSRSNLAPQFNFDLYSGIVMDPNTGNFYIADTNNDVIRKMTPAGVVTTFAGSPPWTDGTGPAASFSANLGGAALDANGNIYVADTDNQLIRKISSSGGVTTLAGRVSVKGSNDGAGAIATFNNPVSVAVDSGGNVYVADASNFVIRKITPAGVVTTFAGTKGVSGAIDGQGTAATFKYPNGIAIDSTDNLFVSDSGNFNIRKITPAGLVSTFTSLAYVPSALTVDTAGNLYIAVSSSHLILQVVGGVVSTLAGTEGIPGSANETGTAASFNSPSALSVDNTNGIIYVADSGNHLIRKINKTTKVVSTFAGTAGVSGFINNTGTIAKFNKPIGIAVNNGATTVYVTDQVNRLIRKIISSGAVTTHAGSPLFTDATGTDARFNKPMALAVDHSNPANIYVADSGNYLIRKIAILNGAVTTLAGSAGVSGVTNAIGTAASFQKPVAIVVDNSNPANIFVGDLDRVRKINSSTGAVSTYAGGNSPAANNTTGYTDGAGATAATFFPITAMAIDGLNNLFVAQNDFFRWGMLRFIDNTAYVSTTNYGDGKKCNRGIAIDNSGNVFISCFDGGLDSFIGKWSPSLNSFTAFTGHFYSGYNWNSTGLVDGIGSDIRMGMPAGLTVDGSGNILVIDSGNSVIRKVSAAGVATTLAGTSGVKGYSDGTGVSAVLSKPMGLAVDSASNVYVADSGNHLVRKITAAGVVSTVAGIKGAYSAIDGPAATAGFNTPTGVVLDSNTNLYVTDRENSMIRKITAGVVSTFAGNRGTTGAVDNTNALASFNGPKGFAVDKSGNIYVADTLNHIIRKVTTAGVVTTFAGTKGVSGSVDGTGAAAQFNLPTGVAVDSSGNVYVADTGNHVIRKISPAGVTSNLYGYVGKPGASGTGLNSPQGVAVDSAGKIYVADTGNNLIRKFPGTPGILAGGAGWPAGSTNGTGTAARFNAPTGIAVDSAGNVFVADTGNHLIRKITSAGVVTTFAGIAGVPSSQNGTGVAAGFYQPTSLVMDAANNIYVADTYNSQVRKITSAGVVTTILGSNTKDLPKLGALNSASTAIGSPLGVAYVPSRLFILINNGILTFPLK